VNRAAVGPVGRVGRGQGDVAGEAAHSAHPSPSDDALVQQALRDRNAFAALYDRYADRLYRYAVAQTGNVSAAEDIVSETMLAAIEGLQRFDATRGTFAGWLFGIASRQVSARRRRYGRLLRVLPRAWEPEGAEDDTLSLIVRSADAAHVRELLAKLPERDREIVLLRYGAELTSAEIGTALGMKSSAVRVRLMRVLGRLAAELGDMR
jgi:RNA polymerase sigma factor (sigma-70 family)